jgi:secondary thiamine-phosphate synthase enzyme
MHKYKVMNFITGGKSKFINITKEVQDVVKESGVKFGSVIIQSMHTTCAVIVNEHEDGLLEHDFIRTLEKIAPSGEKVYYKHDDFKRRYQNMCDGECKNGHSHCKAIGLPVSQTLIIADGQLQLGRWQQIFFLELDRKRDRSVEIFARGE